MTTFIGYLRHPGQALVFLLVYWGRTICYTLLGVCFATRLLGTSWAVTELVAAFGFAVAMFNYGLALGEIIGRNPLPGKRR